MVHNLLYIIGISDKHKYLIHIGGDRKRKRIVKSSEIMKELKTTYMKKIDDDPDELPYFETVKMNKSFMSYMHHSLTQSTDNPELATTLVKRARGHKKANTTVKYLFMNNKDGTLDQACLSLFRRKQFGWIFDELACLLTGDEKVVASVRTKHIEDLRNAISLYKLESDAGLVLIQQKREVIEDLLLKSKEELREFAIKLFSGQLPSRKPNCSCYVGKDNCKTRTLDCYMCPMVIPNEDVLKQLGIEIERSIEKMRAEDYEILLIKESQRISKLLVLVQEAVVFIGSEKIDIYLNRGKINKGLKEINFAYWREMIKSLWESQHKQIINQKLSLFRGE